MTRRTVRRERKSDGAGFEKDHRMNEVCVSYDPIISSVDGSYRRSMCQVTFPKPSLRILIVLGLAYFLPLGVDFINREVNVTFMETDSEVIFRALSVRDPAVVNATDRDVLWNTTSFCLLIKDDGEILNEWIAYHYHVLNMRKLIVAVDPSSETSPEPTLQKWEEFFGMSIEIWRDEDFMPASFLRGEYDTIKSYVSKFRFPNGINSTTKGYQEQLTIINNHRYRQHVFVSKCLRSLKGRHEDPRNGNWVAHVDSDEYIVLNPRVRENIEAVKPVLVPQVPSAGSLLSYLNDGFSVRPAWNVRRKCLLMPRILYIPRTHYSKKKQKTVGEKGWNTDRFETLRWQIHRELSEPSGVQKAIMDVSAIEKNHSIFENGRIRSVHFPLPRSEEDDCPVEIVDPDLRDVYQYPLAINHYIGSLERYLSRNDTRRHESIWRKKAEMRGVASDGWIGGWLNSFVEEHGLAKVSRVLQDYRRVDYQ